MRTINVIEIINNKVVSIKSFNIFNEEDSQKIIKKTENYFLKLIRYNEAFVPKEDKERYLKDRYYEDRGYCVSIVWSEN
jgi:dTDP-D-glucose 4,6-dehydratase